VARVAFRRVSDKALTKQAEFANGQTIVQDVAQMAAAGLAANAVTTRDYSSLPLGEVDMTECLNARPADHEAA